MSTKTISSKSSSATSLLFENINNELTFIEKIYSKGGINWFEVNPTDPYWLDNEHFTGKPDLETLDITKSTR